MKKVRLCVGLGLTLALLLTGCGASADSGSVNYSTTEAKSASYDTAVYEEAMEMETAEELGAESPAMAAGVSSTSGIESVSVTSQKLIKTVDLNMETKEFDNLLAGMTEKVTELGGYVENSEVNGNSYYGSGRRYAWLRLRIPAEKLDGFVTIVSEMGNVTYKNESVEDITLEYVDVESHKQALVTEQERLLTLLESAENMEDIIQIETRLSEIRYELQSYESRLRTMDNQVSYSTVTVSISEVERITEVEEKTFWEEIAYRLSDNLYDIGQGLRDFVIWLISSLPYLVIWAVVILVLVWVARKVIKKKGKKEKKEKKESGTSLDSVEKETVKK